MTAPLRDKVAKLDANAKQQIADKLDAEEKQLNINMEREKSLKALSDKEFEINRKARMRTVIKRVIYGTLGLGADKYIKSKTGLGI